MKKSISSRVKAIAVCAAMLTTAIATPTVATGIQSAITSITASAATATASSIPFDFSSTTTGKNTFTGLISDYVSSGAKKITFTIEASQATSFSYGFGISVSMDNYWRELNKDGSWVDTTAEGDDAVSGTETKLVEGTNTITIDLSDLTIDYQSKYGEHFEFRNYYVASGTTLSITKVAVNDSSASVTTTESTEEVTNQAADTEGKELTDDTSDSDASVYLGYTADLAESGIKTITVYLSTETVLDSFSYGFGIGTAESPYWYEYEWDTTNDTFRWVDTENGTVSVQGTKVTPSTTGATEFSVTFDVSSLDLSYTPSTEEYPGKFEFRNYYSAGQKVTVTKVVANADPGDSLTPTKSDVGAGFDEVLNDSTITYDELAHTATIVNTITRKLDSPTLSDGKTAITLAAEGADGTIYDEEYYTGEDEAHTYVEGTSPINSHKFSFGNFGLSSDRIAGTVEVQSLSVTLSTTDDQNCTRFMYGGGISVVKGSPADTEYVKQVTKVDGKENASYWYNDCGASDLSEYLELLEQYKTIMGDEAVDVVTPGTGYDITDPSVLGSYFTVTWDVPDGVKEYVTSTGNISFQYWYGEAEPADGEDYAKLGDVTMEAAYVTYTETTTVPYTGEKETSLNETVASGDSVEFSYADDLGIESYQDVYAVVWNVTVPTNEGGTQMVFDFGTSTTLSASNYYYMTSTGENTDSIYKSSYAIPKADGTFDIVWLIPSGLATYSITETSKTDTNYIDSTGTIQFGNWYTADWGETPTEGSITINSATVLYRDGLEFGLEDNEIELEVGDTYQLVPTVGVTSYTTKNESVCTVDENGLITATGKGVTTITAVSEYGQEVTITVTVTGEETTESETGKPLYGDVTVDGDVSMSDVVLMCKQCVGSVTLDGQAAINGDCNVDGLLDASDATIILGLNVMRYTQDDMPLKD